MLTADAVRRVLDLWPNATRSSVRVTFTSPLAIAPGGAPAPRADGRPLGSALFFVATPDAPVRLRRIRNDRRDRSYPGDPLELVLLHDDGASKRVAGGPDLRGGGRYERGDCLARNVKWVLTSWHGGRRMFVHQKRRGEIPKATGTQTPTG